MALRANGSREARQQAAAPPRRRSGSRWRSLALVLIFLLILFPYGRFRDVAVARLAEATGASVSMDDLDGGLSIGGPSLLATNLLLRWPDGRELCSNGHGCARPGRSPGSGESPPFTWR